MVTIEIVGPGLVVNGPAALIYKAFRDAGYEVPKPEFDGQHQYMERATWPENELADMANSGRQSGMIVLLRVVPQPWGG